MAQPPRKNPDSAEAGPRALTVAPGPGNGSAAELPPESAVEEAEIRERTRALIAGRGAGIAARSLIAILQAVQRAFGYLPRSALLAVAEELELSPARVYGVATFYNQFRFKPPGRHPIKVCMGTACAIKLGGVILDAWERRLEIPVDEVTPDREYSLERVACVGCCSMAPVTVIGETVHGSMTPTKVDGILLQHRIRRVRDGREQPEQTSAAKKGAS